MGWQQERHECGRQCQAPGIAEEACLNCRKSFVHALVYFRDNIIERVELVKSPIILKGYFEILDQSYILMAWAAEK